jgi:hypothetical protein
MRRRSVHRRRALTKRENKLVKQFLAAVQLVGLGLIAVILVGTAGCSAKRTIGPVAGSLNGIAPAEADARAEYVRRDPLGYLHEVRENCRDLEQYTVEFTRQERRGIGFFKTLREPEHIACKFRREPFSIYMKWTDPDIKYGESTYVEGEQNDKVRFVPRHGLFGLPPQVTRVDLQTPVIWGESVYPLTAFGVEQMIKRTFRNIERAAGDLAVSYHGLTTLPEYDGVVHFLRLEFPPSQHTAPIQELFIDVETDLPACTRILRPSGELHGAYVWNHLDPGVALTDEDFLLDAERRQRDPKTAAARGSPEPAEETSSP